MVRPIDAFGHGGRKKGRSSITHAHAATLHGVLRQTLQDRISGKVHHRDNPGPKPSWSSSEEKDLANFLIDSSKVGYGKSCQRVKSIAACGACDEGRLQFDKVLSDG